MRRSTYSLDNSPDYLGPHHETPLANHLIQYKPVLLQEAAFGDKRFIIGVLYNPLSGNLSYIAFLYIYVCTHTHKYVHTHTVYVRETHICAYDGNLNEITFVNVCKLLLYLASI